VNILRTALRWSLSVLLVLLAFLWVIRVNQLPRKVVVVRDCENRYGQARSKLDTMTVDQQLTADRSDTCGAMRRAGRLR